MIMIYLINKTLLIQSSRIMDNCNISIINSQGNAISSFEIRGQYIGTFPLKIESGKYLVRVLSGSIKKEKKISI